MICATQLATLPSGFRDIVPHGLGGAVNGQVQPLAFERKSVSCPAILTRSERRRGWSAWPSNWVQACYQASAAACRWQEPDPSSTERQHGNWKRYKGG